ncbi:MAG: C-20 methyltransferase BchU, partial [Chlorobiaceae bacterium]|nr:C-20 methyltransferase BchU [Chlorobiaceae bacterium]
MSNNDLLNYYHRANELVFKGLIEFSCVKAAIELDLFSRMAEGPKDLATLAAETASVPPRLEM